MKINTVPELSGPVGLVEEIIGRDRTASKVLAAEEFSVGLASDPRFATPLHALEHPAYVGDAAHVMDAPDAPEIGRAHV